MFVKLFNGSFVICSDEIFILNNFAILEYDHLAKHKASANKQMMNEYRHRKFHLQKHSD